jgi:hypothetical protein
MLKSKEKISPPRHQEQREASPWGTKFHQENTMLTWCPLGALGVLVVRIFTLTDYWFCLAFSDAA